MDVHIQRIHKGKFNPYPLFKVKKTFLQNRIAAVQDIAAPQDNSYSVSFLPDFGTNDLTKPIEISIQLQNLIEQAKRLSSLELSILLLAIFKRLTEFN